MYRRAFILPLLLLLTLCATGQSAEQYRIYKQFEDVEQFPYIGADLSKRVSFKTDYKYVINGNYVILYKVGREYVEIYRVVNRFQDITRIFG